MKEKTSAAKKPAVRIMLCLLSAAILVCAGIGIGYQIHPEPETPKPEGYAANSAYEYMVGAAAWQMSL